MENRIFAAILFAAAVALALTACTKTSHEVQVELRLTSGSEVQLTEGESVHVWVDDASTGEPLYSTQLEARFTPSKSDDISVRAGGIAGENPIEMDTYMTPAADAQGADDNMKMLNEAIIVPQTLAEGTGFIRLITEGGRAQVYNLPSAKTFEPARKYRFTVTASLTGSLEVTTETSGWTDCDSEIGEASRPNIVPIGDKSVRQAVAGDYYLSDGSVLGKENTLTERLASNVIGIVFYTGHHSTDNSDYSATGIGQAKCHGYAVALTDAHNGLSDRLEWMYGPNGEYNDYITEPYDAEAWNGYYNKSEFHEYVDAHTNESWEMIHFPAAFACETYGNRTLDKDGNPTTAYAWQQALAAPDNSSGWFLPSIAQLSYLYNDRSLLSARMEDVKKSLPDDCNYKRYVRLYNILDRYWSSTEYSNNPNSVRTVDFGDGSMGSHFRRNENDVRAIFAF